MNIVAKKGKLNGKHFKWCLREEEEEIECLFKSHGVNLVMDSSPHHAAALEKLHSRIHNRIRVKVKNVERNLISD